MTMTGQAVTFELNGESRSVAAPADMPLLWALRDLLGLTGTKYACGIGVCGACTVHLDGVATRSCVTPIANVAGRAVTTIEGLADDPLHDVQRMWAQEQVPQCGYCQPGQVMACAALFAEVDRPTDGQMLRAMSGNLCRCGTYGRIVSAMHALRAERQG